MMASLGNFKTHGGNRRRRKIGTLNFWDAPKSAFSIYLYLLIYLSFRWPAMIEIDPDLDVYFETDKKNDMVPVSMGSHKL